MKKITFPETLEELLSSKPYVHPSAVVLGDVEMSEAVSVWPHATLRGDFGGIRLGKGVNIQENTVVHVEAGELTEIGEYTLVGHGAVIHGAKIGKAVLVGINSLILDGALIGDGSILTAGVTIRGRKKIPPRSLVTENSDGLKIYEGKANPRMVIEASLYYMLNARNYQNGIFRLELPDKAKEQVRRWADMLAGEMFK